MKVAAAEERRVRCRRIRPRKGEMTALALAVLLALAGCGPFGRDPRPGLWVVGADGTGESLTRGVDRWLAETGNDEGPGPKARPLPVSPKRTYLRILVTVPAPTVRPPSRIA